MTETVLDLRAFTHLTILHRSRHQAIYRLLYPTTVRYLQTGKNPLLLDEKGILIDDQLDGLVVKVNLYERLFTSSLVQENLDRLLQLDEVRFLLDELMINNPPLEKQLEQRLYQHLNQPYVKRYQQPIILANLLSRHEFVTNYLQTNIGLPEESDNYYNKLREMIEQLEEQTGFAEPDYFLFLQTLLRVCHSLYPMTHPLILSTPYSSCVLVGGSDTLPPALHNFVVPPDQPGSIKVTNSFIYRCIQIYQGLE
ncbi:MAG: hypothetical protein ACXAE3_03510 [Candidatus Kariarchaeaceae archaeon]|jgi:hypothetical protein